MFNHSPGVILIARMLFLAICLYFFPICTEAQIKKPLTTKPAIKKSTTKTTTAKFKEKQLKDLKTRTITLPDGSVVAENHVAISVINEEGIKDDNVVAPVIPDEKADNGKVDYDAVFEKVDEKASFKGGLSAWKIFLQGNINSDTLVNSGAPAGVYRVIVQFKVDKDGTVKDIKADTHLGYQAEEEAIRVMKKSPKWIPAKLNGRNVASYFKQPITFRVEEE